MLRADNPLPPRPRRILVAGVSGSGKSTLAARIAVVLDVPYTEIDSLFHGPDWTPRPEFVADVEALTAAPAWVSEWQYRAVRPMLARRAEVLVWLDLPFWRVTYPRLVRRTLRRRWRRTVLWNGNVEPGLWTIFTDRDHILRWAVRTRHTYREAFARVERAFPDLRIVRLRTTAEVASWVDGPLARSAPPRA